MSLYPMAAFGRIGKFHPRANIELDAGARLLYVNVKVKNWRHDTSTTIAFAMRQGYVMRRWKFAKA